MRSVLVRSGVVCFAGILNVALSAVPAGASTYQTISTNYSGSAVEIADVDGDGYNDIVLVSSAEGVPTATLQILYGPDQSPGSPTSFPADYRGMTPTIKVIDFDGDGHRDVLVAIEAGVFLWRPGVSKSVDRLLPGAFANIGVADFNGDGSLDLAAVPWLSDAEEELWHRRADHQVPVFGVQLWFGGSGGLGNMLQLGTEPNLFAIGDVNGDGFVDIVRSVEPRNQYRYFGGNLVACFGHGDGTFESHELTSPLNGFILPANGRILIGDFTGDGIPDLLTGAGDWKDPLPNRFRAVGLFRGDGSGLFARTEVVTVSSGYPLWGFGVMEDGAFPRIYTFGDRNPLEIQEASNGVYAAPTTITTTLESMAVLGDVTGDGIEDFVVLSTGQLKIVEAIPTIAELQQQLKALQAQLAKAQQQLDARDAQIESLNVLIRGQRAELKQLTGENAKLAAASASLAAAVDAAVLAQNAAIDERNAAQLETAKTKAQLLKSEKANAMLQASVDSLVLRLLHDPADQRAAQAVYDHANAVIDGAVADLGVKIMKEPMKRIANALALLNSGRFDESIRESRQAYRQTQTIIADAEKGKKQKTDEKKDDKKSK